MKLNVQDKDGYQVNETIDTDTKDQADGDLGPCRQLRGEIV